jgi:hypothetical protein
MWRKLALAAAVGLPALGAATSMAMAEDVYVVDDDYDDAVIVETRPVVVETEKPVVVFKNYEDEWESDNRLTCGQAADAIEDLGFDQVVSDDCSGSTYTFVGNRDGDVYVIRVDARTGEIVAG